MAKVFKKDFFICLLLVILSSIFLILYLRTEPIFLSNPDSAKFAEVARNLKNGRGLTINYSLCKKEIIDKNCFIFTSPPLYPLVISFFMRVFGENDKAVIYASGFFYIFSILLTYFLAKKLFNTEIGLFSALTLIFTEQFLFHSISGASETFFTCLLIVNLILIFLETKLSLILVAITSILLVATKIQGIFYLPLFIFSVVMLSKEKKWVNLSFYIFPTILLYLFLDKIGLKSITNSFWYLFNKETLSYFFLYNSSAFPSGSLDQVLIKSNNFLFINYFKPIILKITDNLYTAFKTILNITNPLIMVLFFLSFLKREKQKNYLLKLLTLFLFLFFLLSAAVGVFNIRYSHPLLPLIIIFAIAMFFEIVKRLEVKRKDLFTGIYFLVFIIFFSLTQINLGVKILKKDKNVDKPSIYFLLGKKMSEISKENETVATNLEIWGSWYGKRKTVLIPAEIKNLPEVNFVFLSSFSPGTEMSSEWQRLFDKPKDLDGYRFMGRKEISASENYQNIPVAVEIFKRK